MLAPVTVEDKFQEDGDLIYAGEYLDIVTTPKSAPFPRLDNHFDKSNIRKSEVIG
jgi:hypothetical protein